MKSYIDKLDDKIEEFSKQKLEVKSSVAKTIIDAKINSLRWAITQANGVRNSDGDCNLPVVNARTFTVGEKVTWRGDELFVAEVGNNEVLLATDMNVDADDYNDWWVANVYVR